MIAETEEDGAEIQTKQRKWLLVLAALYGC